MTSQLAASSDVELLTAAQDGDDAAFAVLVHRHAPRVLAMAAGARHPLGAATDVFVRALRQLPERPADDDVVAWLDGLTRRRVRHVLEVDEPVDAEPDDVDAIWVELDSRWPDGRKPWRIPRWISWIALIVLVLSLSVLVPYLALTFGSDRNGGPTVLDELIAVPLDDTTTSDEDADTTGDDPTQDEQDEDEFEEPPVFRFPDVDEPEPGDEAEPGGDADQTDP